MLYKVTCIGRHNLAGQRIHHSFVHHIHSGMLLFKVLHGSGLEFQMLAALSYTITVTKM